ncbi:MAG: right-handed parallel beta-helix repeat-containing protein [Marinilabiliaceae bacterium]|nr:right-handed parallel beta-helix repeat-containing protein [Marinilabiliaceae bacterium]
MMKLLTLSLALMASLSLFAKDYVITRHGVKADSTLLNTRAIQKVIDKAHAKGGGTIVVPKGVFLTGALFFKPGTRLKLMEGAVIKGSDTIADYPLMASRMEGKNLDYFAALINATHVKGFSITGPGTIDGNGYKFWDQFWARREEGRRQGRTVTNLEVHRPRLIFIWGCDSVTLRDVKLRNAGFWTTHLYQCNDVLIEGCDIRSPFKPVKAPSTDGIDLDVCKRVTIRNCYISVNDDGVCIKGGKGPLAHTLPENGIVEDVLIENCTFGQSHGTLTLGSECIHARNITLRNCVMQNTCPVLRLKMRPDTHQIFENITIENITGNSGPLIEMRPWKQFFDLEGTTQQPKATVRNIVMSNIHVTATYFGEMAGNAHDTVSDIVFRNITVQSPGQGMKCLYPDAVTLENVSENGEVLQLIQ